MTWGRMGHPGLLIPARVENKPKQIVHKVPAFTDEKESIDSKMAEWHDKYFQSLLSGREFKEKQHWHWHCQRSASPANYLLDIPIKVGSVQFPKSPPLLLHWVSELSLQELSWFSKLEIIFLLCVVSLIWPMSCRGRYREWEVLLPFPPIPCPHQL